MNTYLRTHWYPILMGAIIGIAIGVAIGFAIYNSQPKESRNAWQPIHAQTQAWSHECSVENPYDYEAATNCLGNRVRDYLATWHS